MVPRSTCRKADVKLMQLFDANTLSCCSARRYELLCCDNSNTLYPDTTAVANVTAVRRSRLSWDSEDQSTVAIKKWSSRVWTSLSLSNLAVSPFGYTERRLVQMTVAKSGWDATILTTHLTAVSWRSDVGLSFAWLVLLLERQCWKRSERNPTSTCLFETTQVVATTCWNLSSVE